MIALKFISVLMSGFFWLYWMYFVIFTSVMTVLVISFKLTRAGSRLNFLLCFAIIVTNFWFLPGLIMPFFLARPFHWQNALIMAWFQRKIAYLTGFTYEVRRARYIPEDKGGVVCCNHQSALDVLGDMSCGGIHMRRRGTISKKTLLYFFPLGFASWLANIIFIDRSNPKACYQTLQRIEKMMKQENFKILFYPEGTRSMQDGFLPFKKGAFTTAIQAQVPVFPIVYCPYYYYDDKAGVFLYDNKHHIISYLKPISTKGMTEADVDNLKQKVHDVMLKEYEKLKKEVESKSKDPRWVMKPRPRVTILR